MRLLDSLERRFGRYAIRGIFGYIAFFQCMVFAVVFVNKYFAEQLFLAPFTEMDGEWWRLVSFIAVPAARSPLMFIFTIYIALICAYRVEPEMGTFRLNLFVGLFVVCQWAMAAVAGTEAGESLTRAMGAVLLVNSADYHSFVSTLLFTNLFFVFAVMEPRRVFLLFGIVPLPVWVLALTDAGLILFNVLQAPALWLVTVLSLTPFLCFAVPIFIKHSRHRNYVGSRRTRFKANSLTVTDSFHSCSVCGRTDASDPDLDFRITEDGIEYCTDHLPKS